MDKTPVVGMGATRCVGSDAYPYVIVGIVSDKTIDVMRLSTMGVNAWDSRVTLDPATTPIESLSGITRLRKDKHGCFTDHGTPFYIGAAQYRLDPSF
jgi:hypothetical protein